MKTKRKHVFPGSNLEGKSQFDLPTGFWSGRLAGVSAMVRLRNEERYVEASLLSVVDLFDEIVVAVQPSTDKTQEIVDGLAGRYPKIKSYRYPFTSILPEPNYFRNDPSSVHNLSYYYNWVLSKTTRQYVFKWDGDVIMFRSATEIVRKLVNEARSDIIHLKYVDIYGPSLSHQCDAPHTASEPALFRVTPKTFYFPGEFCEEFTYPVWRTMLSRSRIHNIERPLGIHMKYATASEDAADINNWPANWRDIPHYQRVIARKRRGEPYRGPFPQALRSFLSDPDTASYD